MWPQTQGDIFYSEDYSVRNVSKLKYILSRLPRMIKQLKIHGGNQIVVEWVIIYKPIPTEKYF